jgi:phosphoglycerate dehydrogenase-like enzyme
LTNYCYVLFAEAILKLNPMKMNRNILVSYAPGEEEKDIYRQVLEDIANVHYLADKTGNERIELLNGAEVIIALSFSQKEFDPTEISRLENVRFVQLIFAGADDIPFACIPDDTVVASNAGAFAEPIAEHVLALTLALAKNLFPKYKLLCDGRFDRSAFNRKLKDGICGIIGFGGNGRKIARIMRAMGMEVYGINRSGKTEAPVDFMGKATDMKKVLQVSDVVVVTTPLTRETRNLLGKKELDWMKSDAILINVGRGDVIDQQALYAHLKSNPDFCAGIDTWWSEPVGHEDFTLEYPFCKLPNFIGSPHIADHVPGSMPHATRLALENVKNFLLGEDIRGMLDRNDYLNLE